MQLTINHITRYTYENAVDYALQKVRLRPMDNPMQTVDSWQVSITGGKQEADYRDHYGNHVDLISTEPGVTELTIAAQGTVTTHDVAGILGHKYGRAPLWHFAQPTPLTQASEKIKTLAEDATAGLDPLAGLHALSAGIIKAVPYQIGNTDASTTAEDALTIGSGVCQDHANIMIAAARAKGLPARYVSGYLMMNDRVDQDASHAWAEVHIDDLGWVGFDVSNGISPDERYVRLAIGRDAADAAPISGLRMGAGDESLIVSLQVQQ